MPKPIVSVRVFLRSLLILLLVSTPSRSQTPINHPQEMQQVASDILSSSSAKYLSNSGRTALELATGRLSLPEGLLHRAAPQRPGVALPSPRLPLVPAERLW